MQPNNARIMRQMAELQAKKNRLQDLWALRPFKKATFFFYAKDETFISLDQTMLPFDMTIEMAVLIESSIEFLDYQIKELSNQL
jgi:hypothetical protein